MNTRVQLICARLGLIFILPFFAAWGLIAGMIPPRPAPELAKSEVAKFYIENELGVLFGMAILLWLSILVAPPLAALTLQVKRIEGEFGPLTLILIICSGALIVTFIYPELFWITGAFRADRSPDAIMVLNDLGWLGFMGVGQLFVLIQFVVGFGTLRDKQQSPVFPRWFGYSCFGLGIGVGFGTLVFFFHEGPFAWNGLVSFWLVATEFGIWWILMCAMVIRAINRQASKEKGHDKKDRAGYVDVQEMSLEGDGYREDPTKEAASQT